MSTKNPQPMAALIDGTTNRNRTTITLYKVLRIVPETEYQLKFLNRLEQSASDLQVLVL